MLLSLLLVSGCINLKNDECSNQQYLALNGDCVQDPGPTEFEIDTASDNLDDDGGDGDGGGNGGGDSAGATNGGSETDGGSSDADADAGTDNGGGSDGGGDPMLDEVNVTCDAGSWYYQISTAVPTESATITVTETGSDDGSQPSEFHTLTMAGASASGGETYERDLLLVADYYFEDVATQFLCTEGTNSGLTWQIDLYSDAGRTVPIGCVTWGHDTSGPSSAGCQLH